MHPRCGKKRRRRECAEISIRSSVHTISTVLSRLVCFSQKVEHVRKARQCSGKFCWLKRQVVYEGRSKKEIFCALAQRSAKIPHVHRLFFVHTSILYVITKSVHHVFHVFGGLRVEKKKRQLRRFAAQCETSRRYSVVSASFFRYQYRVR